MSTVPDQAAREAALNIDRSVIVQAPAGSGKTTLLTQRFLRLLAHTELPEQIIAITFTNKASLEMRERIEHALLHPNADEASWVAQIIAKHPQLLSRLQRLQVMTFDQLTRQIIESVPLESGLPLAAESVTDAMPLYELAAQRTLLSLAHRADATVFLQALDNRFDGAINLLAELLKDRGQWLSYVWDEPANVIAAVDRAISAHIELALQTLDAQLASETKTEWLRLHNISNLNKPIWTWPSATVDNWADWQTLADLVFTGDAPRKRFDARNGFPLNGKGDALQLQRANVAAVKALAALLAGCEAAVAIRSLPTALEVDTAQFAAIVTLLKAASANLNLLFMERGQVDFDAISFAAVSLLQEQQHLPVLSFIDGCQHVLVDEFQDTSPRQLALLQALCHDWQGTANDGRSLFLVGDPMQSIYRFRQAVVGLFQTVRTQGIGRVRCEFVQLSCNFRSLPLLVDAINRVFKTHACIDSETRDFFAPATTPEPASAVQGAFTVAEFANQDAQTQAVIEAVKFELARDPEQQIAILTRTRASAYPILDAFKQAGIVSTAPSIYPLIDIAAVRDVLSLAQALAQLDDRLAWCAVLRSPWFGLSLKALSQFDHSIPIVLQRDITFSEPDDARRWQAFQDHLGPALQQRQHWPLLAVVHLALQSLASLTAWDQDSTLAVEQALTCLAGHVDGTGIVSQTALFRALRESKFEGRHQSDSRVQVMTIHRAKGLQFGSVILPDTHLQKNKPAQEVIRQFKLSEAGFVMAVKPRIMRQAADQQDKSLTLFQYIGQLDIQAQQRESTRQLYVALTRAKQSQYVFALQQKARKTAHPPHIAIVQVGLGLCQSVLEVGDELGENRSPTVLLRPRLSAFEGIAGSMPHVSPPLSFAARSTEPSLEQVLGNVFHQWVMHLSRPLTAMPEPARLAYWLSKQTLGLSDAAHALLLKQLQLALANFYRSEAAMFCFDPLHRDWATEQTLWEREGQQLRARRVDLSFVSADNTRWIIDYKLTESTPEEARTHYQQQLADYAKAYRAISPQQAIQCALYLPLTNAWLAWPAPA
jgi:ATP-dependent helicase/nuclease subunit A